MAAERMICQFCGGASTLLCDGLIYTMGNGKRFRVPQSFPNGKTTTCDAPVCRSCAKKISDIHVHSNKGCRWDTRDLCPDCQQAQEKPVEIPQ